MKTLASLIVELADSLAMSAGGPELGVAVGVVEAAIELPVESRLTPSGEFLTTAPRGILATGFDTPHGRLRARFDLQPLEEGASS